MSARSNGSRRKLKILGARRVTNGSRQMSKYWARCSRDVIVWLGGVHGTQLMPAAADFGHVYNDGYRSPADPYFAKLLKTDFMWSLALKNVSP